MNVFVPARMLNDTMQISKDRQFTAMVFVGVAEHQGAARAVP